MSLIENVKSMIKGQNVKIVFPEGEDLRVLKAVSRLNGEKIINPILIGNEEKLQEIAKNNDIDIKGVQIIDHLNYKDINEMLDAFIERRQGKNNREQAIELMKNVNYFGTMLTYLGKVDGMVSGAVYPTGDTVRPALQIIKTRKGITKVSGAFIMLGPNKEKYIFADCAININLTPNEMAEIAVESAKAARAFGVDDKVAMLSFSTKGSADCEEAKKVADATIIARKMDPSIKIDGELQFDAAIVESVGKKKAPNSKIAGKASVYIFPSLEAGNIGYKIAQRLGGYEAVGPILLGLNKPISDLSRGCNTEDIYKLSLLTAAQSFIK